MSKPVLVLIGLTAGILTTILLPWSILFWAAAYMIIRIIDHQTSPGGITRSVSDVHRVGED